MNDAAGAKVPVTPPDGNAIRHASHEGDLPALMERHGGTANRSDTATTLPDVAASVRVP